MDALRRPLAAAALAAALLLPPAVTAANASPNAASPQKSFVPEPEAFAPERLRPVLDRVQRACFEHFWRLGNDNPALMRAGMVTDTSAMTFDALAVGGSGFGVMAAIVGAERGWVSREAAAKRIRETIDFLEKAERFHGAWAHWVDRAGKARPFGDQIKAGDLVETSFMLMGLLCAQEYFDRDAPDERAIRVAVDRIRHAIEWDFYVKGDDLHWLWESTTGRHSLPLRAYNEALVTYILAIGAPSAHAIDPALYRKGWLQNGRALHPGRHAYGIPLPLGGPARGGPLFLSHYTFLGIDPRVQDDAADYLQNGIRHTLVNRAYCLQDAPKAHAYGPCDWGLTACAGPGRRPYAARCPARDDGVLAPTAALASFVYTPWQSAHVLLRVANDPALMTPGGPVDAYVPASGETAPGRIAIDQGPILLMLENYRSGLLWRLFMRHPDVRRGLARAGFHLPRHPTGFPYAIPDLDGACHLLRHPDRGDYSLTYSLDRPGAAQIRLTRPDGAPLHATAPARRAAGLHTLALSPATLPPNTRCHATLLLDGTPAATVTLHTH